MEMHLKNFENFSLAELYQILQLRSEVFVVEQNCVYQDIDGKDQKALHVFCSKNNQIVAYARCFEPGVYFEEAAIGRILVKKEERKHGLGSEILKFAIHAVEKNYHTSSIKLSAQQYLIGFYQAHGFKTVGEGYLEDGIPHVAMLRE